MRRQQPPNGGSSAELQTSSSAYGSTAMRHQNKNRNSAPASPTVVGVQSSSSFSYSSAVTPPVGRAELHQIVEASKQMEEMNRALIEELTLARGGGGGGGGALNATAMSGSSNNNLRRMSAAATPLQPIPQQASPKTNYVSPAYSVSGGAVDTAVARQRRAAASDSASMMLLGHGSSSSSVVGGQRSLGTPKRHIYDGAGGGGGADGTATVVSRASAVSRHMHADRASPLRQAPPNYKLPEAEEIRSNYQQRNSFNASSSFQQRSSGAANQQQDAGGSPLSALLRPYLDQQQQQRFGNASDHTTTADANRASSNNIMNATANTNNVSHAINQRTGKPHPLAFLGGEGTDADGRGSVDPLREAIPAKAKGRYSPANGVERVTGKRSTSPPTTDDDYDYDDGANNNNNGKKVNAYGRRQSGGANTNSMQTRSNTAIGDANAAAMPTAAGISTLQKAFKEELKERGAVAGRKRIASPSNNPILNPITKLPSSSASLDFSRNNSHVNMLRDPATAASLNSFSRNSTSYVVPLSADGAAANDFIGIGGGAGLSASLGGAPLLTAEERVAAAKERLKKGVPNMNREEQIRQLQLKFGGGPSPREGDTEYDNNDDDHHDDTAAVRGSLAQRQQQYSNREERPQQQRSRESSHSPNRGGGGYYQQYEDYGRDQSSSSPWRSEDYNENEKRNVRTVLKGQRGRNSAAHDDDDDNDGYNNDGRRRYHDDAGENNTVPATSRTASALSHSNNNTNNNDTSRGGRGGGRRGKDDDYDYDYDNNSNEGHNKARDWETASGRGETFTDANGVRRNGEGIIMISGNQRTKQSNATHLNNGQLGEDEADENDAADGDWASSMQRRYDDEERKKRLQNLEIKRKNDLRREQEKKEKEKELKKRQQFEEEEGATSSQHSSRLGSPLSRNNAYTTNANRSASSASDFFCRNGTVLASPNDDDCSKANTTNSRDTVSPMPVHVTRSGRAAIMVPVAEKSGGGRREGVEMVNIDAATTATTVAGQKGLLDDCSPDNNLKHTASFAASHDNHHNSPSNDNKGDAATTVRTVGEASRKGRWGGGGERNSSPLSNHGAKHSNTNNGGVLMASLGAGDEVGSNFEFARYSTVASQRSVDFDIPPPSSSSNNRDPTNTAVSSSKTDNKKRKPQQQQPSPSSSASFSSPHTSPKHGFDRLASSTTTPTTPNAAVDKANFAKPTVSARNRSRSNNSSPVSGRTPSFTLNSNNKKSQRGDVSDGEGDADEKEDPFAAIKALGELVDKEAQLEASLKRDRERRLDEVAMSRTGVSANNSGVSGVYGDGAEDQRRKKEDGWGGAKTGAEARPAAASNISQQQGQGQGPPSETSLPTFQSRAKTDFHSISDAIPPTVQAVEETASALHPTPTPAVIVSKPTSRRPSATSFVMEEAAAEKSAAVGDNSRARRDDSAASADVAAPTLGTERSVSGGDGRSSSAIGDPTPTANTTTTSRSRSNSTKKIQTVVSAVSERLSSSSVEPQPPISSTTTAAANGGGGTAKEEEEVLNSKTAATATATSCSRRGSTASVSAPPAAAAAASEEAVRSQSSLPTTASTATAFSVSPEPHPTAPQPLLPSAVPQQQSTLLPPPPIMKGFTVTRSGGGEGRGNDTNKTSHSGTAAEPTSNSNLTSRRGSASTVGESYPHVHDDDAPHFAGRGGGGREGRVGRDEDSMGLVASNTNSRSVSAHNNNTSADPEQRATRQRQHLKTTKDSLVADEDSSQQARDDSHDNDGDAEFNMFHHKKVQSYPSRDEILLEGEGERRCSTSSSAAAGRYRSVGEERGEGLGWRRESLSQGAGDGAGVGGGGAYHFTQSSLSNRSGPSVSASLPTPPSSNRRGALPNGEGGGGRKRGDDHDEKNWQQQDRIVGGGDHDYIGDQNLDVAREGRGEAGRRFGEADGDNDNSNLPDPTMSRGYSAAKLKREDDDNIGDAYGDDNSRRESGQQRDALQQQRRDAPPPTSSSLLDSFNALVDDGADDNNYDNDGVARRSTNNYEEKSSHHHKDHTMMATTAFVVGGANGNSISGDSQHNPKPKKRSYVVGGGGGTASAPSTANNSQPNSRRNSSAAAGSDADDNQAKKSKGNKHKNNHTLDHGEEPRHQQSTVVAEAAAATNNGQLPHNTHMFVTSNPTSTHTMPPPPTSHHEEGDEEKHTKHYHDQNHHNAADAEDDDDDLHFYTKERSVSVSMASRRSVSNAPPPPPPGPHPKGRRQQQSTTAASTPAAAYTSRADVILQGLEAEMAARRRREEESSAHVKGDDGGKATRGETLPANGREGRRQDKKEEGSEGNNKAPAGRPQHTLLPPPQMRYSRPIRAVLVAALPDGGRSYSPSSGRLRRGPPRHTLKSIALRNLHVPLSSLAALNPHLSALEGTRGNIGGIGLDDELPLFCLIRVPDDYEGYLGGGGGNDDNNDDGGDGDDSHQRIKVLDATMDDLLASCTYEHQRQQYMRMQQQQEEEEGAFGGEEEGSSGGRVANLANRLPASSSLPPPPDKAFFSTSSANRIEERVPNGLGTEGGEDFDANTRIGGDKDEEDDVSAATPTVSLRNKRSLEERFAALSAMRSRGGGGSGGVGYVSGAQHRDPCQNHDNGDPRRSGQTTAPPPFSHDDTNSGRIDDDGGGGDDDDPYANANDDPIMLPSPCEEEEDRRGNPTSSSSQHYDDDPYDRRQQRNVDDAAFGPRYHSPVKLTKNAAPTIGASSTRGGGAAGGSSPSSSFTFPTSYQYGNQNAYGPAKEGGGEEGVGVAGGGNGNADPFTSWRRNAEGGRRPQQREQEDESRRGSAPQESQGQQQRAGAGQVPANSGSARDRSTSSNTEVHASSSQSRSVSGGVGAFPPPPAIVRGTSNLAMFNTTASLRAASSTSPSRRGEAAHADDYDQDNGDDNYDGAKQGSARYKATSVNASTHRRTSSPVMQQEAVFARRPSPNAAKRKATPIPPAVRQDSTKEDRSQHAAKSGIQSNAKAPPSLVASRTTSSLHVENEDQEEEEDVIIVGDAVSDQEEPLTAANTNRSTFSNADKKKTTRTTTGPLSASSTPTFSSQPPQQQQRKPSHTTVASTNINAKNSRSSGHKSQPLSDQPHAISRSHHYSSKAEAPPSKAASLPRGGAGRRREQSPADDDALVDGEGFDSDDGDTTAAEAEGIESSNEIADEEGEEEEDGETRIKRLRAQQLEMFRKQYGGADGSDEEGGERRRREERRRRNHSEKNPYLEAFDAKEAAQQIDEGKELFKRNGQKDKARIGNVSNNTDSIRVNPDVIRVSPHKPLEHDPFRPPMTHHRSNNKHKSMDDPTYNPLVDNPFLAAAASPPSAPSSSKTSRRGQGRQHNNARGNAFNDDPLLRPSTLLDNIRSGRHHTTAARDDEDEDYAYDDGYADEDNGDHDHDEHDADRATEEGGDDSIRRRRRMLLKGRGRASAPTAAASAADEKERQWMREQEARGSTILSRLRENPMMTAAGHFESDEDEEEDQFHIADGNAARQRHMQDRRRHGENDHSSHNHHHNVDDDLVDDRPLHNHHSDYHHHHPNEDSEHRRQQSQRRAMSVHGPEEEETSPYAWRFRVDADEGRSRSLRMRRMGRGGGEGGAGGRSASSSSSWPRRSEREYHYFDDDFNDDHHSNANRRNDSNYDFRREKDRSPNKKTGGEYDDTESNATKENSNKLLLQDAPTLQQQQQQPSTATADHTFRYIVPNPMAEGVTLAEMAWALDMPLETLIQFNQRAAEVFGTDGTLDRNVRIRVPAAYEQSLRRAKAFAAPTAAQHPTQQQQPRQQQQFQQQSSSLAALPASSSTDAPPPKTTTMQPISLVRQPGAVSRTTSASSSSPAVVTPTGYIAAAAAIGGMTARPPPPPTPSSPLSLKALVIVKGENGMLKGKEASALRRDVGGDGKQQQLAITAAAAAPSANNDHQEVATVGVVEKPSLARSSRTASPMAPPPPLVVAEASSRSTKNANKNDDKSVVGSPASVTAATTQGTALAHTATTTAQKRTHSSGGKGKTPTTPKGSTNSNIVVDYFSGDALDARKGKSVGSTSLPARRSRASNMSGSVTITADGSTVATTTTDGKGEAATTQAAAVAASTTTATALEMRLMEGRQKTAVLIASSSAPPPSVQQRKSSPRAAALATVLEVQKPHLIQFQSEATVVVTPNTAPPTTPPFSKVITATHVTTNISTVTPSPSAVGSSAVPVVTHHRRITAPSPSSAFGNNTVTATRTQRGVGGGVVYREEDGDCYKEERSVSSRHYTTNGSNPFSMPPPLPFNNAVGGSRSVSQATQFSQQHHHYVGMNNSGAAAVMASRFTTIVTPISPLAPTAAHAVGSSKFNTSDTSSHLPPPSRNHPMTIDEIARAYNVHPDRIYDANEDALVHGRLLHGLYRRGSTTYHFQEALPGGLVLRIPVDN